ADRAHDDVPQRQEHDDEEDGEQDVHAHEEDPVADRLLDPCRQLPRPRRAEQRFGCGHHSPRPVTRFAMMLTPTSSTRLMTELNRPMAVERLKSACCRPTL